MAKFTRIGDVLQKKRKKLIIFISTGDTCRAPMASGYFRKLLKERDMQHIEVRDAGIMTVSGLRATAEAIQVLDTVDVDLRRHSSRKLSNESIKRADLILGMSSFHVQTALRQTEHARNKTVLLKEYVNWEHKNVQISDPMGGTLEVYKKCFQEIKEACDRLVEHPFIVELESPNGQAAKTSASAARAEGEGDETAKNGKKKPAVRKKDKAAADEAQERDSDSAPETDDVEAPADDSASDSESKPVGNAKTAKPKKSAAAKSTKAKKASKSTSEQPASETKARKTSASKAKKKATTPKKKS